MTVTEQIVREFIAGLSMQDLASKRKCQVLHVEKSIRRWLYLFAEVK